MSGVLSLGFPIYDALKAGLISIDSDRAATSLDLVVDAPRALEELIHRAEQAGASDIHLQRIGSKAEIDFRLDGVLTRVLVMAENLADRVFGRIKYLSRLKTYQESLPQEGRIAHQEVSSRHDIRVATYPALTGEKIVLRLFHQGAGQRLVDLDFPDQAREQLESFLRGPAGLMLLTGPAGSGKTTTIYACLRYLVELGGRHIITIEDPAEQVLTGVMQTEINEAIGLNFSKAARHLLRQDPQVLVVGEIRDEETANLVVRAALTGHLVIATLHAGSCRAVLERLLVMCSDRYAGLSALSLILNQRLIRRVCPGCQGMGCVDCLKSGYRGRTAAVETFQFDESSRVAARTQGPDVIRPPIDLRSAGRALLERGLTTEAELTRVFGQ